MLIISIISIILQPLRVHRAQACSLPKIPNFCYLYIMFKYRFFSFVYSSSLQVIEYRYLVQYYSTYVVTYTTTIMGTSYYNIYNLF